MKDLIIKIAKGSKVIGSCKIAGVGSISSAFHETKAILDNYNRHLIDSGLDDELLALRMLEEENKDGSLHSMKHNLELKSYDYLREKYPDENIIFPRDNTRMGGRIAILNDDICNQHNSGCGRIALDIIAKRIHLNNLFTKLSVSEYCIYKAYDVNIFNEKIIPIYDMDFDDLHFNDLDEAMECIVKCYNGWKLEEDGKIFVVT